MTDRIPDRYRQHLPAHIIASIEEDGEQVQFQAVDGCVKIVGPSNNYLVDEDTYYYKGYTIVRNTQIASGYVGRWDAKKVSGGYTHTLVLAKWAVDKKIKNL